MAGILTRPHFQRLEALRRVNLVLQGEPDSISLQKRDPNTGGFTDFLSIDRGFYPFFTRDPEGGGLPAKVQFEAQISELMVTDEDAKQVGAIQHGQQRFYIVRWDTGEAGIFPPIGPQRFWRFWLAPLEEVL
jgi:hypothetical protein